MALASADTPATSGVANAAAATSFASTEVGALLLLLARCCKRRTLPQTALLAGESRNSIECKSAAFCCSWIVCWTCRCDELGESSCASGSLLSVTPGGRCKRMQLTWTCCGCSSSAKDFVTVSIASQFMSLRLHSNTIWSDCHSPSRRYAGSCTYTPSDCVVILRMDPVPADWKHTEQMDWHNSRRRLLDPTNVRCRRQQPTSAHSD